MIFSSKEAHAAKQITKKLLPHAIREMPGVRIVKDVLIPQNPLE